MKELNIEQKARRYDEAIERAKRLHSEPTGGTERIVCEQIFPELKESEDERIRKMLIEFFRRGAECNSSTNGISDKNIIAWLEKHKYSEEDLDKAYKCADEVQYRRGYEDAKKEIEKQGEVPVTINIDKMVEDYANDKECNNEGFGKPVNCMIRAYRQGITDTLVILNLRKQGEQKPADKIEREYHCTGVREPKEATGVLKQLLNKENYAWSEEDEAYRVDILVKLEPHITDDNFTDVQNWFKSIKERYLWKPSEEQIEALEHFVRSIGESGYASPYDNHTKLVYSLLLDLKKLK